MKYYVKVNNVKVNWKKIGKRTIPFVLAGIMAVTGIKLIKGKNHYSLAENESVFTDESVLDDAVLEETSQDYIVNSEEITTIDDCYEEKTEESVNNYAEGEKNIKKYVRATTKVNVRSNCDSSNKDSILTTLKVGDVLEAICLLDNGWYEVLYNGQIAYINASYVEYFEQEIRDAKKIVRATSDVRVREENNTSSKKLGTLSKGDVLDYLRTMPNGWHEVMYNGSVAYVSGDYSEVDTEGIHKEVVPVVTAKTSLNVRSSSSTGGRILYTLKKGESLQYTQKLVNGWYEVLLNGQIGYVHGDYVQTGSKEMVTNKVYKVVSIDHDTTIYADCDFTTPLSSIPKYELCHVYNSGENYYLVKSDCGTGYIRRSDTKSLGDVAVVVDVSSQLVSLFKDGEYFLTSSVVTGKNETPTDLGLYEIRRKKYKYHIQKYNVDVDFWMPFNGDQGLHDASWRKNVFGGEIYKKNGSHGCVNLPYETAETIYNNVEEGTKVLIKR